MKPNLEHHGRLFFASLIAAVFLAFVISFVYEEYRFYVVREEMRGKDELLLLMLRTRIELTSKLQKASLTNSELAGALQNEQALNNSFSNQINGLQTAVGTLTKLSQTDKELLQKYSKIYFLNENYVPSALSQIPVDFITQKSRTEQVHTNVLPYLLQMLSAASSTGAPLQVISAYRSFGTQSQLKSSYRFTYGGGTANAFSADQGYSEHQLGTAVDLTTVKLGTNFTQFEGSMGYNWLVDNAYRYGFILSYPKNNGYYVFEPWHWRFVGVQLATFMHNQNKYFYEIDQRTIDQYLINIFD